MHIKKTDSSTVYPYSPPRLRADNPGTSFPAEMSAELLAEWGVFPVTPTPSPVVDHTQNVAEAMPALINGAWTQAWSVTDATPEEIAARADDQASAVRADRNRRLAACDWTQLPDSPVDAGAWAAYRQALRDVTAQAGFPWAVAWPTPPA